MRWCPSESLRPIGELARHISLGRVTWFARMDPEGWFGLSKLVTEWESDEDGNRHPREESLHILEDPGKLVWWLESTWHAVTTTLGQWQVEDLFQTYTHTWNGATYAVTRQWTVFRILAHDIHHGGELSLMLGMQGVQAFELSALGGHITLPPRID